MSEEALINFRSDSEFGSWSLSGGVFKFRKSDSGDDIVMTIHKGYIPVTYTKIKP